MREPGDPLSPVIDVLLAGGATIEERWGTVTLTVARVDYRAAAATLAGAGLCVLDHLTAVDEPEAPGTPALDVVAVLVRDPAPGVAGTRLLLRTRVGDAEPVASLSGLFASAAWFEREVAEMFGARFDGFVERTPDGPVHEPRPLLTAGWDTPPEVPPLRRSTALTARAQRPWPGAREPVEPDDLPADAHRRRAKGRRPLPPGVPG